MTHLYFLQNQHGDFLDKTGEWSQSSDGHGLYKTSLKDEAINQSVEFSVKNPDLRISIVEAAPNESGKVQLPTKDATTATALDETSVADG